MNDDKVIRERDAEAELATRPVSLVPALMLHGTIAVLGAVALGVAAIRADAGGFTAPEGLLAVIGFVMGMIGVTQGLALVRRGQIDG